MLYWVSLFSNLLYLKEISNNLFSFNEIKGTEKIHETIILSITAKNIKRSNNHRVHRDL